MTNIIGKGKFIVKKSGNGKYKNGWIYVSSKIFKDNSFPFTDQEEINIEIRSNGLFLTKKIGIVDLIKEHGLQNATLPKILEKKALKEPNHVFIYFRDKKVTYKKLNENSNRIANGLLSLIKRLGFGRSNVALMLPNSLDFIYCEFGIIKAGCTFVPVNYLLDDDLLEYILSHSRIKILILEHEFLEKYKRIQKKLPEIKKIIVHNAPKGFKFNNKMIDFQEINTSITKNPDVKVKDWHKMQILYTSGSIGKPKGILLRNHAVLAGLIIKNELLQIQDLKPVIVYCPFPLFIIFTQIFVILPSLFHDSSIIITREFNASIFWQEVREHGANLICYNKGVLLKLLNEPVKETDKKHSIKGAFGSEAPKELWEIFENRFNIPIYEGWPFLNGSTVTINKKGSKGGKIGSVGKPINGFELKIVNSDGKELEPGSDNVGEIISRSTLPISLEFYRFSGDKKKKYRGSNWVRTGNLGYKDKDGFFYIIGQEETIIRRHDKIFSPHEIEKVVNAHPFVLESAAIGLKKEQASDDEIKLCVVLKTDGSLKYDDLYNYLVQVLPYYMIPRFIEFKQELPKTLDERIKRLTLMNEMQDETIRRKTWDVRTKDFIKLDGLIFV
ncbi:MAG: class I adenylate-forming enzyme family protein [Candidatus Helarchaeota archaeon]